MKLVVQRVLEANVTIDNEVCGAIKNGLLVLLGIHKDDKAEDIAWFINKLLYLRIFNDSMDKMNLSVQDIKGGILLISQFTLYGNSKTGRRPDFLQAAPPAIAIPIYEKFLEELKGSYEHVQSGKFGADMKVFLINDGPVTLILEK